VIAFTFSSVLTIHDHVKRAWAKERGGLLAGVGTTIAQALPARNEADDPTSAFAIGGEQLAGLVDSIDPGLSMMGTYHSHPNGRADMSPGDAALAEDTGLLLIVAPGVVWEWRLWNPSAGGEVLDCTIAWPGVWGTGAG
jgi:proteasome lid subunit RPN8/RPN11